jgi:hypothetical protein
MDDSKFLGISIIFLGVFLFLISGFGFPILSSLIILAGIGEYVDIVDIISSYITAKK